MPLTDPATSACSDLVARGVVHSRRSHPEVLVDLVHATFEDLDEAITDRSMARTSKRAGR